MTGLLVSQVKRWGISHTGSRIEWQIQVVGGDRQLNSERTV